MVHGNKFPIVLEHHDLVSRISRFFGVFPVVDCYLCSPRTVLARDMEYPASCNILSVAQTLLAYAAGAVGVGIGRDGPGTEPKIQTARSDERFRIANDEFLPGVTPSARAREWIYEKRHVWSRGSPVDAGLPNGSKS
jgi:hypothetical protein